MLLHMFMPRAMIFGKYSVPYQPIGFQISEVKSWKDDLLLLHWVTHCFFFYIPNKPDNM